MNHTIHAPAPLRLTAGLLAATVMLLAGTTVHATTKAPAGQRTEQIRLRSAPEFSEEGVHLRTDRGDFSLYAVHATEAVMRSFERARAGQCLRLVVNREFNFSDASGITRVGTDCR